MRAVRGGDQRGGPGSTSSGSASMPTAPWTAIDAAASRRVASAGSAARPAQREQPERLAGRRGEPGAELDRRPVVLAAAEADEHRAARRVARAPPDSSATSAGERSSSVGELGGSGCCRRSARRRRRRRARRRRSSASRVRSAPQARETNAAARAPGASVARSAASARGGRRELGVVVQELDEQLAAGGASGAASSASASRAGAERAATRTLRASRRGRGRRGRVERRVLAQDRLLEPRELRRRLDPERVDQRAPQRAVGGERVLLAAGAVERGHQLGGEALVGRVLVHERLELGDEPAVLAERELGLDALLERGEAQLLEPRDRRRRERLVGEVGERRAAPQRERLAQQRRPRARARRARAPTAASSASRSKRLRSSVSRPGADEVARRPRLDRAGRGACAGPRPGAGPG